jgi:ubiquinone/menaquinone biosynthesis C-methylase UbiE
MHTQPGRFDPWRTDHQPDEERLREMAQRIELRGAAPEEIAARQAYLDLLHIHAGQRVLDVGCGTGVVTRDIARRLKPNGEVLGIDPNPHLLKVARELAPPDLPIELRRGDATNLAIPDETFDTVVCITVLEHMVDPHRAIPELVRATRPGGRVGILCGDQESFIVNHPIGS